MTNQAFTKICLNCPSTGDCPNVDNEAMRSKRGKMEAGADTRLPECLLYLSFLSRQHQIVDGLAANIPDEKLPRWIELMTRQYIDRLEWSKRFLFV